MELFSHQRELTHKLPKGFLGYCYFDLVKFKHQERNFDGGILQSLRNNQL